MQRASHTHMPYKKERANDTFTYMRRDSFRIVQQTNKRKEDEERCTHKYATGKRMIIIRSCFSFNFIRAIKL